MSAPVAPDGLPFRDWDAARRAPVEEAGGMWLVSGHALVREVLADTATFAPDNALDAVTPMPPPVLRLLARQGFRLPATLANNGSPSHPALRAVVAEALHPARVEQQRGWLTGVVRRRVARLATAARAGAEVDLHAGLARDLPLAALARLVVLPSDDVAAVKRFSAAALELFWAPLSTDRQQVLAGEVAAYQARLRAFARTAPGLVARLREVAAAHGRGEDDVVGALFFLVVAGQETTSQFLTLLLHRLATEPAVLAGLVGGTVAVDDVVEEALRLEPPIVTWRRVATRDVALGGQRVPRGATVLLRLAAAGRDRAVVAEPDRFGPGQPGSRRHLAFGVGAHRCLGAQLARVEAAVVVEEVAPLLARCRVVRPPSYPDNLSFRRPDALVVALG